MALKQESIRKIRDQFGLNIYETKVWTALLRKGVATAGEIAKLSNVPRSRTYDVLESLEKRGFAMVKVGKPVKYVIVNPSTVVEKLRSNVLREADERAKNLEKLKNTEDYKQIELLHKQGAESAETEDLSIAIKGKHNLLIHLGEMISKASKSIMLATDPNAMRRKVKMLKPILARLKRKGVNIKIAVNGNEEEIKNIAKEIKTPIRDVNLDARFCVVDNKELLFMTNPSSHENDKGIWVNSQYFANALSNLFERAWGSK